MKRSTLSAYLLAVVLVGATSLLKLLVDIFWDQELSPFTYFLIPVVITAWAGGGRPGLFSLLVGAAAALLFFSPLAGGAPMLQGDLVARLATFLLEGVLLCVFAGLMRRAREDAEHHRGIAEGAYREARESLDELKRTEAALREAIVEAESANRIKSDFLANISHELRTPMNAIIGMTDLALQADLPDEVAENLEISRESANSLLRLLNDLLDFSRIESGKFSLVDEPFSLETALVAPARSAALRAFAKGLELSVRIPPAVPKQLIGDAMRLAQLIENFVNNAVKFTERGEVAVEVMLAGRNDHTAQLRFCVRDTGIGISPEDQERIFAPFMQIDASSTRQHHGSGLGLAIASQLVNMMGGRLWLESQPGAGSKFYFTLELPIAPVSNDRSHLDGRLAELRGRRALVVDENVTAREAVVEILDGLGLEVACAPSLAEAASILADVTGSQRIDLVVVDALVSGTEGFSLAAEIELSPHLRQDVIVMISAFDRRAFAARCERLCQAVFVEKPVAPRELAAALVEAAFGEVALPAPRPGLLPLEPKPFVARVLVTEDTLANQKVIERVLQKRGHQVSVAHNGRQAMQRCRTEQFDVVLMDVQMPTMDGFQATAAIRALGPATRRSTGGDVPVVALTAHVMKGDRERCLDAGMDAYLGKPFDAAEVVQLIERLALEYRARLGDRVASPITMSPEIATEPSESVRVDFEPTALLDLDAALKRLEGDEELLGDVIRLFVEDSPVLLATIDANLESHNAERVERAAHSLKGLAANLDAAAATNAAFAVERAARDGKLAEAADKAKPLHDEVDRLCRALKAVR